MSSLVLLTTTKEGYSKLRELVKEKLSNKQDYNDLGILDRADKMEENEEYGFIVLTWNWVKWNDYYADVQAVEVSLQELEELNIPYKLYKVYENYTEEIEDDSFDEEGVLPEICSELKLTWEYYPRFDY